MAPAPSLHDVIQLVDADAPDAQPLGRLRTASALVRDLAEVGDAALGYFVDQARRAGHSWSEIGEALGVTKQAAQQKHTFRLSAGPSLERLTPRARNVLAAAEPLAREWGHDSVGTEHLLLALYQEPDGLAAQILEESGLSAEKAETAVAVQTQPGPGSPEGQLAFRPETKELLRDALVCALELGHNYIGTEHLLVGLSRSAGVAARVLADAGLPPEVLAAKTTEKLAAYTRRRESARPPKPPTKRAGSPRADKAGAVKRR